MPRVIIEPKDEKEWLELRANDITSTEIGALFGLSPYVTEYELWYRKKNQTVIEFEENERMKWGTILQDAIAEGIAKEQKWEVRRMTEYIRGSDLRIGASFDFDAIRSVDVGKDVPANKPYSFLLEIKNVDGLIFKQQWHEDDAGDLEAPLHIEIQVQHQLLCSGRQLAYIGVLVGGNKLYLLRRERNNKVLIKIREKAIAFWKSIEENKPPEPNFQVDSEFIASLYGYAEPGSFKDLTEDQDIKEMAVTYQAAGIEIKQRQLVKDEMKARMLKIIGDAEKAGGEKCSLSQPVWSGPPTSSMTGRVIVISE